MKMDQESRDFLRDWLVKNLEPICDADPEVLSKYVLALIQNEKPENEPNVKELYISKLQEFLGDETKAFVNHLFIALSAELYKPKEKRRSYEIRKDLDKKEKYDRDEKHNNEEESDGGDDHKHKHQRNRTNYRKTTPYRRNNDRNNRGKANVRRIDDNRPRNNKFRNIESNMTTGNPWNINNNNNNLTRQPYPTWDPRFWDQGRPINHPLMLNGNIPSSMYPPPPYYNNNMANIDNDPNAYNPDNPLIHPIENNMGMHSYLHLNNNIKRPYYNVITRNAMNDHDRNRLSNDRRTISLKNIDPSVVTLAALTLFFSKFGNVLNVQINPDEKTAIVQYSLEEEAVKAFNSPLKVCNNYSISVTYMKKTKNILSFEENKNIALKHGQEILKQKKELNEKKKQIYTQKEELLKKQLEQLNLIYSKITTNEEKEIYKNKIDLLTKELENHQNSMIMNQDTNSTTTTPFSNTNARYSNGINNDYNNQRIKKPLPKGSRTLDNRTKLVRVSDIPSAGKNKKSLHDHFSAFGTISKIEFQDDHHNIAFILFSQRYAGQAAINNGTFMGENVLKIEWVEKDEWPAVLKDADETNKGETEQE